MCLSFGRGHRPRADASLEAAGRGDGRHSTSGAFLQPTTRSCWDRWSPQILREARRGGRDVSVLVNVRHAPNRRGLAGVVAEGGSRASALGRRVSRIMAQRRLGARSTLSTFGARNRYTGVNALAERTAAREAGSAARAAVRRRPSSEGLATLRDVRWNSLAISHRGSKTAAAQALAGVSANGDVRGNRTVANHRSRARSRARGSTRGCFRWCR